MDAVMVAQILAGILGTIIVGAIGYAVGMRGKMTTSDCQKCQTACSERMQIKLDAMAAKYAELSLHQDRIDASIDQKLDILFRMVRAIVMHMPIDPETKAEIINERGGK